MARFFEVLGSRYSDYIVDVEVFLSSSKQTNQDGKLQNVYIIYIVSYYVQYLMFRMEKPTYLKALKFHESPRQIYANAPCQTPKNESTRKCFSLCRCEFSPVTLSPALRVGDVALVLYFPNESSEKDQCKECQLNNVKVSRHNPFLRSCLQATCGFVMVCLQIGDQKN